MKKTFVKPTAEAMNIQSVMMLALSTTDQAAVGGGQGNQGGGNGDGEARTQKPQAMPWD